MVPKPGSVPKLPQTIFNFEERAGLRKATPMHRPEGGRRGRG
jgi:hypothetical protein